MDHSEISSEADAWSEDDVSSRNLAEYGPLMEEQATLQLFQMSNDLFYGQDTFIDPVFGDANPDYGQGLYEDFMIRHPEFRELYEPALRTPPHDGFVMPTWTDINRWADYSADEIEEEVEIEEGVENPSEDPFEEVLATSLPIWRRPLAHRHSLPWRLIFRGLWVVFFPPPPLVFISSILRVLLSPIRRQQFVELLEFVLDN